MFIGHFALGFALKRAAPETNLGWLIAAPQLLDMLWPIFLLTGFERVEIEPGNTAFTPLNFVSYPWSHSLAMALVWSVLAGALYFVFTRYRAGALVIGAGVVSHWMLDVIVHRADLPIYPGGYRIGLGLWNHPVTTGVIETLMFAAGLWLYFAATKAKDRVGVYAVPTLAGVLYIIYLGNIFSPPPPSVTALAVVTLGMWIFPLWAGWGDRHREIVATTV